MDNREILISYAIKYEGNYNLINKAIINKEKVDYLKYDNCLTIFDDNYPKEFLYLRNPPLVLFYKGNIDLLKEDKIAIIGTRNPCEYSSLATKALALNINKVVVSGLAKGIDGIAHNYSARSIGILGCGIDYIYPKENYDLYKKLESTGLILSEYYGKALPLAYNFPFRNRLIAALAKEIYVMEAHEKSGTLTTINEALDLGKEIKVLPFDVFNKQGIYNNFLIEEGASIIKL